MASAITRVHLEHSNRVHTSEPKIMKASDFVNAQMSLRSVQNVNEQPFFDENAHPLLGHCGESTRSESILPAMNAFEIGLSD